MKLLLLLVLAAVACVHCHDVAYSKDSLLSLQRLNSESSNDASMSLVINSKDLEKQGFQEPRIKDLWAAFGKDNEEEILWNDDDAASKFLVECEDKVESEDEDGRMTLHSKPHCDDVMHIVDAGETVADYLAKMIPEELVVKFRIPHDKVQPGKPLHIHVTVEDASPKALGKRDSGTSTATFHLYGRRDFVITSSTEWVPKPVRSDKSISDISVSSGVANSTNTGLWVMGSILVATGVVMGIFLLVHWIKNSSALTF